MPDRKKGDVPPPKKDGKEKRGVGRPGDLVYLPEDSDLAMDALLAAPAPEKRKKKRRKKR